MFQWSVCGSLPSVLGHFMSYTFSWILWALEYTWISVNFAILFLLHNIVLQNIEKGCCPEPPLLPFYQWLQHARNVEAKLLQLHKKLWVKFCKWYSTFRAISVNIYHKVNLISIFINLNIMQVANVL